MNYNLKKFYYFIKNKKEKSYLKVHLYIIIKND